MIVQFPCIILCGSMILHVYIMINMIDSSDIDNCIILIECHAVAALRSARLTELILIMICVCYGVIIIKLCLYL